MASSRAKTRTDPSPGSKAKAKLTVVPPPQGSPRRTRQAWMEQREQQAKTRGVGGIHVANKALIDLVEPEGIVQEPLGMGTGSRWAIKIPWGRFKDHYVHRIPTWYLKWMWSVLKDAEDILAFDTPDFRAIPGMREEVYYTLREREAGMRPGECQYRCVPV